MTQWPEEFSKQFVDALDEGIATGKESPRPIAVFDADGTLWDRDLGEAFLRWLIAGKRLLDVDYTEDIYADYEERVEKDRTSAYTYAVQLMRGLPLRDILEWSLQLAYAWPNYRSSMKYLVHKLREEGFETWIVSASNEWSVTMAARFMGFEPDQCLGIKTVIHDGIITDEPSPPITCNKGKVEAINSIIGAGAIFAFGDSMGDFEMLESVLKPMVVGEYRKDNSELIQKANERDWAVTLF